MVSVTGIYSGTCKLAFLGKRLVSLSNGIIILYIGSHIYNFIGYNTCSLIHLSVRCFDEAVLIYPCERCKVGDQTDVRSFRSLDGAHSSVVGVVNISNLESCTVSGKTAGAQCGKTSLMSKLSKRVVLIHEL